MKSQRHILEIIELLKEEYPLAYCELDYKKDYELMISVRLSAQCTDRRVNIITESLFKEYPSLEAFANADISDIERLIRSCGFYRVKARDIVLASQMLIERFDSKIPDNMEDLLSLPGIGRKSANLLLGDIYNVPSSVVVDTHVIRITNKLGLVDTKDPLKIENLLREQLPPLESNDFCHRIVLHGRALCTARSPKCHLCPLAAHCDYFIGNSGGE